MGPVYGKGAVLSVCNVGFDAFTLESTAALLNGRTVVLPGEEEQESPRRLAELIAGYGVGFLSITPSRLTAFLRDPTFCRAMRQMERIICGGEDVYKRQDQRSAYRRTEEPGRTGPFPGGQGRLREAD